MGLVMYLANSDDDLRYGMENTTSYEILIKAFSTVVPVQPGRLDIRVFTSRVPVTAMKIIHEPVGAARLPDRPMNVVIAIFESTRADAVGKRLNGRLVAPQLTALAAQGTRAEYAYAHAAHTTAALKAIFTGSLGVPPTTESLFYILKHRGYNVAVFSGQDEAFGDIDKVVGERANSTFYFDALSALGDRTDSRTLPGYVALPETRVLAEFNRWSKTNDWARPQFIYFNIQAPHYYYYHNKMKLIFITKPIPWSEISSSRQKEVAATYWNAVANADEMLGAIVARLRQLQIYDNTLLVVLGDHGESLFDDGFLGHGYVLNENQTHIPLIFSKAGIRLNEPTGEIDVRDIVLNVLSRGSGQSQATRPGVVFQYVGPLEDPIQIGMVAYGGRRTIIDFDKKAFFFSDLDRWFTYSQLREPQWHAEYERVQRLAELYECYRNQTWLPPESADNRRVVSYEH
jgi:Sulfatase